MDAQVDVAIIGTGFSGLGMAIKLKQAGIDSFVGLLEDDERVDPGLLELDRHAEAGEPGPDDGDVDLRVHCRLQLSYGLQYRNLQHWIFRVASIRVKVPRRRRG